MSDQQSVPPARGDSLSESATDAALLRFGVFELHLRTGELRRAGAVLSLPPQPFKILVLLAAHSGQLVTREEIQQQIWGSETFVDFEQGLNFAVNKIRTTLGDEAGTPRYIETLPRRGYRFIAPVEEIGAHPGLPGRQPVEAGTPPHPSVREGAQEAPTQSPINPTEHTLASAALKETVQKRQSATVSHGMLRQWTGLSLAAMLIACIAVGLFVWHRARFQTAQASRVQIHSLAVLPLANLSGDPSQNYFADGMTDELTTDLARISGLTVISETSAMQYRGTHEPLRQIAQELGVDAVIEGSVARSGDQVRITAQLIDAKNDRHLWAQSYDRQGSDVLGLERDLSKAIASQVHITLTLAEDRRLEALPTHDQRAYDAYLHAKYNLDLALSLESDADATITQAEQAVALDPDFAEAYVVLAQGCVAKIFGWAGGREYDEKAFVALGKALALNPALGEAYATRGQLYYNHLHSFDIASAVADYRHAIALNPNLAEAHHGLASELTHAGLHDQAVEEFRAALRLNPQDWGPQMRLGRALWQSQRFAEALENYERYHIENVEKALTLVYLGRRQQALETIDSVAKQLAEARSKRHGDPADVAALRAFLYATQGQPQKAQREIQIASSLGKNRDHFHHAAFILAAACAEMSKPHEAVTWLRRVAESGMPNYPLFRDNPSMSKLHGNPEYEQFMADLKLRWDQLATTL
jgi:TolB-like protein/DNA-binding winged helix-turn-helix (wHTH) protein/Tfp pilus assembly protein PilF